jgi:hypothetical protein
MVVGTGEVGGHVLEFLARTPGIQRLCAMDVDDRKAGKKLACAMYGAMFEGYSPRMELVPGDVFDVEKTARDLRRIDPDIIINTASLQSWWVVTLLPEDAFWRIHRAGIGPWLPMHLAPTWRLMQAVRDSGINTKVVSIPFPDVVNPTLAKVGLAPTVGAGNHDELVPPLQRYVGEELGVPPGAVQVFFVGHHFHNDAILGEKTMSGAPYYLKILVDDEDVSARFPAEESMVAATAIYPDGKDDSPIIASSAIKNALAMLNDTGLRTHAPGPQGLPGGYPVRLDASGARVTLPQDLSLAEAISINLEAQKWDGIERINEDGSVEFTQAAHETMKELLGYECRVLSIDDVEAAAREMKSAYRRFAARFGL